MSKYHLSSEKCKIIDALLAETGLTVEKLLHNHEQASVREPGPATLMRYLTVAQVCEICAVSRFTVARWMKKNLVKFCKLSKARGGKVLINARSLYAFLDDHSNVSS